MKVINSKILLTIGVLVLTGSTFADEIIEDQHSAKTVQALSCPSYDYTPCTSKIDANICNNVWTYKSSTVVEGRDVLSLAQCEYHQNKQKCTENGVITTCS